MHIYYNIFQPSCMFFFFNREWTGDLKKLPNIKMREVSAKGFDSTVASHNAHMDEESEEDETCQNTDTNL